MLTCIICIVVVIFGIVCWIIDLFDDSEAKYRAEQEFRRVEDKKNYSELDYSIPSKMYTRTAFGCYWIGNYLRH